MSEERTAGRQGMTVRRIGLPAAGVICRAGALALKWMFGVTNPPHATLWLLCNQNTTTGARKSTESGQVPSPWMTCPHSTEVIWTKMLTFEFRGDLAASVDEVDGRPASGRIERLAELGGGGGPGEFRDGVREMRGAVLIHHVHVDGAGQAGGEEVEHSFASGQAVGEHQMADQEAARSHTLLVADERSDLPVHLRDGGLIVLRVVLHTRQTLPYLGIAVLHVGHVDIYETVEEVKHIERIVAAGVVDERDGEAALSREQKGLDEHGDDMRGRNPVDVVRAGTLQAQHHIGQFGRGHRLAVALLADGPVLAEHAVEIASREEDRARSA